ncbi:MAG: outer membrane protein assembly factor BamA [Spirochaetales bacterium]|nr:outer membrane protein assembly factor BamA [Spirochaetales bacterium]
MRKILIGIVILLLSQAILVAQDNESWFVGKPIKDFVFKGLNTVSVNEIRPIVRDYIGQILTLELFWEIWDKLWALEKFDNVESEAKPGDDNRDSVIIEFTVVEKPIISMITLKGNNWISRSDILEKVVLKEGDYKNDAQISIDEEKIKELYISKGFDKAQVKSDTVLNAENNTVELIFTIAEGYKTTVKSIQFSGNIFASTNSLKDVMETKESGLFSPGVFEENIFIKDQEKIKQYYHDRGFIDVKIEKIDRSVEVVETEARNYLNITIYIVEGNQYTIGEVSFEGNTIFSSDELQALIRLKPGKIFSKEKFESDFQAVVNKYMNSGYIYNEITKEEKRDELNKIVRYLIKIVERDKAHIEKIIITGNMKTKDYIILRELPLEVGDVFSLEKLQSGYYNLMNTQYFRTINIKPEAGSSEGLMDLVINVEEDNWADFKFGFVFSGSDYPISGQIGWNDKNFLGLGYSIGADVEVSNLKQGFEFRFQNNYLFGKNWGGGATLSFYHTVYQNAMQDIMGPVFSTENIPDPYTSLEEYENAINNVQEMNKALLMEYDSYDIELAVNSGKYWPTALGRLGISAQYAITATYVWYDSSIYRHYNKAVRDNLNIFSFVNLLGATLYLDARDIYYNPENGYILSQYAGIGFGNREYITTKSRFEYFLTLFKIPVTDDWDFQTVFAFHSGLSFIFPSFTGNLIATEKEKLYIDGMNTARGWPIEREKEALLDFNVELRNPLSRQFLWLIWFFDAAAAFQQRENFEKINLNDFYFSFGLGLRLTIPGLPLRMYFAQRFKYTDGVLDWMTGDFSMGPLNLKFVLAIQMPGGF